MDITTEAQNLFGEIVHKCTKYKNGDIDLVIKYEMLHSNETATFNNKDFSIRFRASDPAYAL